MAHGPVARPRPGPASLPLRAAHQTSMLLPRGQFTGNGADAQLAQQHAQCRQLYACHSCVHQNRARACKSCSCIMHHDVTSCAAQSPRHLTFWGLQKPRAGGPRGPCMHAMHPHPPVVHNVDAHFRLCLHTQAGRTLLSWPGQSSQQAVHTPHRVTCLRRHAMIWVLSYRPPCCSSTALAAAIGRS
jgi:hypothetical protein